MTTRLAFKRLLTALPISILLAGPLASPLRAQTGVIEGRVIGNAGEPVAGATIRLRGSEKVVVTSEVGSFTFAWLEPGVHWLEIQALGYAPRTDSVLLAPNATIEVEARLMADPVDLPALVVTARSGPTAAWLASRGVPQRFTTGDGVLHATRRDLTFQGVRDIRDLLRRTSGVRIRNLVDSGSELLLDPSPLPDGSPCVVGVYLNGVPLNLGHLSEVNFRGETSGRPRPLRFDDLASVEEIDALELYGPDNSPVASATDCGALLIWSAAKRRDWDNDLNATLRGTVVDEATGAPLGNARIRLNPGGVTATAGADGAFEIDNLLPGEYVLRVEQAGAEPWEATVHLQAFGVLTVDLRVSTHSRPTHEVSQEGNRARINFR